MFCKDEEEGRNAEERPIPGLSHESVNNIWRGSGREEGLVEAMTGLSHESVNNVCVCNLVLMPCFKGSLPSVSHEWKFICLLNSLLEQSYSIPCKQQK